MEAISYKLSPFPSPSQLRSVKWLRATWCDNANVIRGKSFFTGNPFFENFITDGTCLTTACQSLPVFIDKVAPDSNTGGAIGEVRIIPDMSTFRILPFAPTRASCASNLVQILEDGSRKPWGHCPRNFLQRQIADLASEGYAIKCGFEYEFCLLTRDKNNQLTGIDGTWCNVIIENKYIEFVDDLTDALVAQKIMPELTHKEASLGQLEFVCTYDDPLKVADNHIAVRETIHAIADKHGMIASFIPKLSESIGSGCHLHISLWKDGKNITPASSGKYFGPEAGHFVAGILAHAHSLVAITTPTCNSFRRLIPGYWAGAFAIWGLNNKEAAVRVSTDPSGGQPKHWELKIVDASSNVYLAIGAIIAVGLHGLRKKLPLPPPVNIDPASLSPEELSQRNIKRLPSSVLVALDHLVHDTVLISALGEKELAASFVAVRKLEESHYSKMELKDEVNELHAKY